MTRLTYEITNRTGSTFTTPNYNEAMELRASGYKVKTQYTTIDEPTKAFFRGCRLVSRGGKITTVDNYRPGCAIKFTRETNVPSSYN